MFVSKIILIRSYYWYRSYFRNFATCI